VAAGCLATFAERHDAYASQMASADGVPDPCGEPESLVVTVDTGDRIHYLEWGAPPGHHSGAAAPGLVLLHGLSATAWTWAPIARRLCARARVLAIDLRGHGLSEAPQGGYELTSQAYDVLTVAVANGWGTDVGGPPFMVAGHGLGAMVASVVASLQPGSVSGLALVDAGWEEMAEVTGATPEEFLRGLGEPPEIMGSMAAYLADRRDYDPQTWDGDQEVAARAAVDEKPAGHVAPVLRPHAQRRTIAAMFDYPARETLSSLRVPLLVLSAEAGSADDPQVRDRRFALEEIVEARRAAGMPPTTVTRFPGVGHNLMRYRADAVAEALDLLLAHQRP